MIIRIFRIMGSLLSSILYIPIDEILFTVVVCDKSLLVGEKYIFQI